MAIFNCKSCGGDLEIQEGTTVVTCEYCGRQQTVPSMDNEKKVNLFNRANRLRSKCDFDKAASVYESIVAEFPTESEAYWGLCLCKFGIEYVDDPATANKIPTCHRTSFESIFDDTNFDQACENADALAVNQLRNEAKEIDRLQKEILEIAKNEQPFDVFICYKESDENGRRTVDSELAHDIYDVLTEKGYKVFYSRITLKAKLGQDYEPYIFSALNSAKVMLSIGTKFEYFNAVWVKNEWSRFLSLMKNDKSKMLIPCYRDIDPYDMPKEFGSLQGQDLNSPRAFQDLVSNIEKIIPKTTAQSDFIQQASGNPTADSLVKRAMMFLEDGDFTKADEYAEKALDANPENANAYLCKLLSELKLNKETELATYKAGFTEFDNYNKILRFGDNETKKRIEDYRIRAIYNNGCSKMAVAASESEYHEAQKIFETIKNYKDAPQKAEECLHKANQLVYNNAVQILNSANSKGEDFQKARKNFLSLGDFSDSAQKAEECDIQLKKWIELEKNVAEGIISKFSEIESIILKHNSNVNEINIKHNGSADEINTKYEKRENAALSFLVIPFIIALIVCICISVPIFRSDASGLTKFFGFALFGIGGGVFVFFVCFLLFGSIWNAAVKSNDKNSYKQKTFLSEMTSKQKTFSSEMTSNSLSNLGVKGTFVTNCKIKLCPQCGAVEICDNKNTPCYKCNFKRIIILESEKISEKKQMVINQVNKYHHIDL
ncbi:MAG: TIR domain-containing protein [Ruminococcaceae bacterium]|nr:TIR domain-containing protein [Oscillospiraceae bacterium]